MSPFWIGLLIGLAIGSVVGFFMAALMAMAGKEAPEPKYSKCNLCGRPLHPMSYPLGIRLICFNGHFQ